MDLPNPSSDTNLVSKRVQVTRRALFARDLSVWGYELMCPAHEGHGGERSSAEVALLNALAEFGAARRLAFLESGEPVTKPSQRRPTSRRKA